ncbi:MAG: hypothetical protein RR399_06200, partial [Lachnospiraceae bacterium]
MGTQLSEEEKQSTVSLPEGKGIGSHKRTLSVRLGILLLILILLGITIFCGWRYYKSRDPHAMDMEAFAGSLPGKTEA